MNKKNLPNLNPTIISLLISGLGMPSVAMAGNYLDLVQYPAGSSGKEPAPNVIISVDDSGSMGWDTGGCMTPDLDTRYGTRFNEDGAKYVPDNDPTATPTNCPATRTENTNKSRIRALKDALTAQFGDANATPGTKGSTPDNSIRLAWQTMHNNGAATTADSLVAGNTNTIKPFSGTHRVNFSNFVNSLKAYNGTPSHKMVKNVYDYMRSPAGKNNPWAENPTVTEGTYLACRRSYHIFLTDGAWNGSNNQSVGNADNTSVTLPDGVSYSITSNQSQAYADSYGDDVLSTLSDYAFKSWATDLQDGTNSTKNISNSVRPLIKKSGIEQVGALDLQQYWNPKNNPATWQHVSTYTIGFGKTATSWSNGPTWDSATDSNYLGGYSALVNNTVQWPDVIGNEDNRPAELWHMALNGRGRYYPVRSPDALTSAFNDILGQIFADTSTPITGFASASTSVISASTGVYQSVYEADGWKGGIVSYTAAQGTAALTPNTAWGTKTDGKPKSTGDLLDARTNAQIPDRVIYTYNAGGKQFTWDNLSATTGGQQDLLKDGATGTAGTTLGQNRLSFIRGDRSLEGDTTAKPFRVRTSRQGDIVNSTVWYSARPAAGYSLLGYSTFANTHKDRLPMLYVGGNDGMLHGFSAEDGTEKIAYIPQGVYKNLAALTKTTYQSGHKYFVDGSPFTGDANVSTTASTPDWRTLLVSTLGAGGKGYFVLDVTTPGRKSGAASTTSTPVSNFTNTDPNASAVVWADKTDGSDADIGYIFGDPVTAEGNSQQATQIARMNDGRWAVVLGNGYNSTNEDPVLVVQYLDGQSTTAAPSIRKIAAATGTTGNATANGLSTPRLVDLNGDGTPDVVYAGDLKGNLWKFDIAHTDPANWKVAFSTAGCTSCTPLFTATEKTNTTERQPIVSPPSVRPNSTGGMMVAFGTGQNLEEGDRTDISPQTFYSVLDNTRYKLDTTASNKGKVLVDTSVVTPAALGSGRTNLVERTFNSTEITGALASTGQDFWNMTTGQTAFAYAGTDAKKGWYLELPISGERVLQSAEFLSGSNILQIKSIVPASGGSTTGNIAETCTPNSIPAKGYLTLMGIEQGLKPTVQLLDADGDGVYNSASAKDNDTNRTTTSPEEIALRGVGEQLRVGSDGKTRKIAEPPAPDLTINWRQLQ